MAQRHWRNVFWAAGFLALLLALSLAPHLTSSARVVRLRNALLYEAVPARADWTPESLPAGYLPERSQPLPLFEAIVRSNDLSVPGDDWQTALRIGRHLLVGVIGRVAPAGVLQEDLSETYMHITRLGEGHCDDYVDVFTALAGTAGIFTRSWAFSFDGFGGRGHVFNEIWDRSAGRWRMIDVFNNYYVVDANERPMSALEFRQALLAGEPIDWRAVEPAARPGYKYPEKAADYYRRGAAQWYLWWGNNVFEYDRNDLVSLFGAPSRPLGQLTAIAIGLHPPIRVWHDAANAAERAQLERLKLHLLLVSIALPLLVIAMFLSAARMRRHGRRDAQAATAGSGEPTESGR